MDATQERGTKVLELDVPSGVQQPPGLDRYFAINHAGMMDLTARLSQLEAQIRQMRQELDVMQREKAEKEKFWKDFRSRMFEQALTKLFWFAALLLGWGVLKWLSETLQIPGVK